MDHSRARTRRRREIAAIALVATGGLGLLATGLVARAVGDLTPGRVLDAVSSRRPVAVDVGVGRPLKLRLHPVSVFEPEATFTVSDPAGRFRQVQRPRFTTLGGTVEGDPLGLVRLTVTRGWVAGAVHAHGHWWSVEPDRWVHPRRTVVRRAELGSFPARLEFDAHPTDSVVTPVGVGVLNCTLFPCDRLRALVVLDADVYFRNIDPATCVERQAAVFNLMIGIYNQQATRITLSSPRVNCRTAADLGTPGTHIQTYLENLRAAWTNDTTDRSVVQLSSGMSFPSSDPIGYAYLGGVCPRITPSTVTVPQVTSVTIPQQCRYGYSVYQAVARPGTNYTASLFLKTKLAAHELGHNFNAEHDPPSLCKTAPPLNGPIMCALLQDAGPNTFSSVSGSAIREHAEANLGSITGT